MLHSLSAANHTVCQAIVGLVYKWEGLLKIVLGGGGGGGGGGCNPCT